MPRGPSESHAVFTLVPHMHCAYLGSFWGLPSEFGQSDWFKDKCMYGYVSIPMKIAIILGAYSHP